ncbi:MAG: ParA family protein [Oscillospiraceae bacterium]|nr:ParA family protein [Oscillospiraceae bacterium]
MIYAISNQKGGVGKTTLTLNLGASLSRMGKKVLLIDLDPQANLTMAVGYQQPDELSVTIAAVIQEIISDGFKPEHSELLRKREYILNNQDMDIIPSSIDLINIEAVLINKISRENALKKLINYVKNDYDIILIDTMPSLNILTINALNAADRVLIPMQPQFFSAKGLELLLSTIANVKENLNPRLDITGVLITMYDGRVKFHKEVINTLNETYGKYFRIFDTKIPMSIRVTETQARSTSIFEHDPNGKIAESYRFFAEELIQNEQ